MRKIAVTVVLVLLVAAGGWLVLGGEAPRTLDDSRVAGSRAQVEVQAKDGPTAGEPEPAAAKETARKPAERVASRRARDELRRRIALAMQAREDAAAHGGGASEGKGDARGKAGESGPQVPELKRRPDDEVPVPGNLIDRTGGRDAIQLQMRLEPEG